MLNLTRLRDVRQRKLLSQADLSQASGVSEATISRLESGLEKARYVTTRKLAQALGVEPHELMGEVKGDRG
jgi:transcriptional regulator with XRE-family HTH domain